jgi:hypothetical protein
MMAIVPLVGLELTLLVASNEMVADHPTRGMTTFEAAGMLWVSLNMLVITPVFLFQLLRDPDRI